MKTLFIILMICCFFFTLQAIVYQVPDDYITIQAALNICTTGDTVLVEPGYYTECIVWPQVDGITLISSGNRENTIIDACFNNRVIAFNGNWENPVITTSTKLRGFTLRSGRTIGNGAGILCTYASPEITDCIVCYNATDEAGSGGGLYCYSASPHFTNVVFAHNVGYSGGGAHIDPLSSPVFNNCVFADNTCFSPGGSFAAGIYGRYQVYFQLNNCTITRNRYLGRAAIQLGEYCTPTIQNTTITDNDYGILVVSNGDINMSNCNIIDNTTAGLWHYDSDAHILNVSNNWWGSDSGPYHEINNSDGTGDAILGNVSFVPWLSSFSTTAPISPPISVHILVGDAASVTIGWNPNPEPNISHYEVNYGYDDLGIIQPTTMQIFSDTFATVPTNFHEFTFVQVAAVSATNQKSWYSSSILYSTGSNEDNSIPSPILLTARPNPFCEDTIISYSLKQDSKVDASIYNVKGELIKSLYHGQQKAGENSLSWNGINNQNLKVANGIYFVRMVQNNSISTHKLVLLK